MTAKPFIEIIDRKIGYDYDPLVIAEIGINHGGSLKEAFKLVDAAKRAGVEVIKHQTHIPEDEMSVEATRVIPGNSKQSIFQIISECALSEKDEFELQKYVLSQGMIFISTPFSRAAVDRLKDMNVPAYKIGSGECNNYPLIELIAKIGKPIILSTGMNNINSVKGAVEIIRKYDVPFALLHTTNLYPTPHRLVRLGALNELQSNFPDAVIGLSDHTVDNYSCIAAVGLGASILERHFTDHMKRVGPDIVNSMDESACSELIRASRLVAQARGGDKQLIEEEQVTRNFAFATTVSLIDIYPGDVISEINTWVKRPGLGEIPASDFQNIQGRVAKRFISKDSHLKYEWLM